MQKDTKKLIFDTFITLLEKKPFDRITVKDIVEACDINRNTFIIITAIFMICLKKCL